MKREDIVKKKFSRMVMGYSPMQVDAFLQGFHLGSEVVWLWFVCR